VLSNFRGHEEITDDFLVIVAIQVLSDLQDYIDEMTTEPWPGATRPPRPRAELCNNRQLRLWYEEGDETVLHVGSVDLR
jgi:hypothetical protein